MMNEKTLKILEFDRILNQLHQLAASEVGKKLALALRPMENFNGVKQLLDETQSILDILRLKGSLPVSEVSDVTPHLKRLSIGASLNGLEIAQIGRVLKTTSELVRFFEALEDEEIQIEALRPTFEALHPIPELSGKIRVALHEDGSVTDEASPKLRELRFQIRHAEAQVREKLEGVVRGKQAKYLSDAVITMRNERYVIPVKAEYRSMFGGVVHDQSASGQTLFMEPKQVVDLNNRRQQAKVAEQQEILRILAELSAEIEPYRDDIKESLQAVAQFDLLQAKGRLAQQMRATIPQLSDEKIVELRSARHPLLDPKQVVANDLYIGKDFKTLVITGPNTGGKTITLKTLGILQLMGQAGLALPVAEESQIAVFNNIFVDIGDEQSIEQNLSTFSGHMKNIIYILKHLDDQSLVLFDELGAGTDPQEGAALAIAILDEVRQRGAIAMATTHYPELKLYGYNHVDTKNASMEFDIETLRPTYRLLIGTPGRSNAFDISMRLGLPKVIVNHARAFIDDETKDLEASIQELETARQKMEEEYEVAHQTVEEATALREELKAYYDEIQHERHHLIEAAKKEANAVVQKAEHQAEHIIEDLREKQKGLDQRQVKEHELIEAKTQLKQLHLTEEEQKLKKNKVLQREKRKKALHIGDEVLVESYGQRGVLVSRLKDGNWKVQLGMLQMSIPEEELTLIKTSHEQQKEQTMATVQRTQSKGLPSRIDLRGERYEEAMREVEQYIDQAIVAGYPSVTIVHGKGTGVLRKGIWQLLSRHRQVKGYDYAPQNAGGTGATIVTFK